jgi:hypothetical protein
MMEQQSKHPLKEDHDTTRLPYVAPSVERVDLMLEETLSAGCKLVDVCTDDFDPESALEAGS